MFFQSPEDRFKKLYKEYLPMVRAVLYNMTGEVFLDDLVQESFLKIWKGLPSFSLKSSVKTWVYRVTVNTAIDHLRKVKFSPGKNEDLEDFSVSLPDAVETSQQSKWIQKFLMELDEDHRSVLTLFYFEELKVEEVARILDIPEGTVKSRMNQARNQLREKLEKKGIRL